MTRHDERGGATVFVLGLSIVLFLCAGLVIDGGMGINTRMRVADDAEQAARAGANAVDVDQLRLGDTLVLNTSMAAANAADFLAARGYAPSQFSLSVTGTSVTVEVRDVSETTILKLLGISQYPVKAGATATAATS